MNCLSYKSLPLQHNAVIEEHSLDIILIHIHNFVIENCHFTVSAQLDTFLP